MNVRNMILVFSVACVFSLISGNFATAQWFPGDLRLPPKGPGKPPPPPPPRPPVTSISFSRGVLKVGGTFANERVIVHLLPNGTFFVSVNDQLASDLFPIRALEGIRAELGSGADEFQVIGPGQSLLHLAFAEIDMGNGDGSLAMEKVVLLANSANWMTIRGSMSQGTAVLVEASSIGRLFVNTSQRECADEVRLGVGWINELTVSTYRGNDWVRVENPSFTPESRIVSARVTTGAGDDLLDLINLKITRANSMHLGSGSDRVRIGGLKGVDMKEGIIDGGDGFDVLQNRASLFGPYNPKSYFELVQ